MFQNPFEVRARQAGQSLPHILPVWHVISAAQKTGMLIGPLFTTDRLNTYR